MKHMKPLVIATLLLLGISVASAQSLGDYARAVRKDKAEPSSTSRHYDNDNLPTNQPLSVVGPPPAADADAAPEAEDAKPKSPDKAAAANPAAATRPTPNARRRPRTGRRRSTSSRKSSTP